MKVAKRILGVGVAILGAVLAKLGLNCVVNEVVRAKYDEGVYEAAPLELLYPLNFYQPEVVYYNNGNVLYRQGDFDGAAQKYREALAQGPARERVCEVRVNLALALVGGIDPDERETAWGKLEEAKNVLYEDHCASAVDESGESPEAEELEAEIKKLQEELMGTSDDPDPQGQPDEEPTEVDGDDADIEEELLMRRKAARESRQEDLEANKNIGNYTYYNGKTW